MKVVLIGSLYLNSLVKKIPYNGTPLLWLTQYRDLAEVLLRM